MPIDVFGSFLTGLVYLSLIILLTRQRNWKDRLVLWLIVYAAGGLSASLLQAAIQLHWIILSPIFPLALLSALLPALLFLQLTRAFLRLEGRGLGGWLFAVLWVLAYLALQPPFAESLNLKSLSLWLNLESLNPVPWGLLLSRAIWLTTRAHQQTPNPLHRNRFKYWVVVIVLMVAAGALQFAGQSTLSDAADLSGATLAVYLVLTHRPPDVRRAARWALSHALGVALAVALYTLAFLLALMMYENTFAASPIVVGLVFGIIALALLTPAARWSQRRLSRWLEGAGADTAQTLREYSLSISNILDLERLAALVVGLTRTALGSAHGDLFLVDREEQLYHLRKAGDSAFTLGHLAATSPVAVYFSHERRPLTQYDIDLLPQFRATAADQHGWLAGLGMDVFVPIYVKNHWIGLLALGPKLSKDRYFDDDLALLSTLADQTAVALENARLVDDLQRVNDSLEQANAALEKANVQLQELDKLKSAFIGVITHELRTPFANIIFSLQLLQRQGQHLLPQQLEQLLQLAEQVNLLKRMVDNLVTFSTFLSKQGELKLTALDFGAVTRTAVEPLAALATAKGFTVHVNIEEHLPVVQGDAERLTEAVHHLVQNAIKFNRPNGTLWVEVWADEQAVRLEVKDTGVGVAADKLPGLWDAFAQMADPLKRGAEGLGLGLALVKYVVTAHGGEVLAASEEGVGSAFGFWLPLSDSTAIRPA